MRPILIAFFLLLSACSVAPAPTATPQPSPTTAPTATPIPPTATAIPPTATPIPPTATSAPTAMPVATVTPIPVSRVYAGPPKKLILTVDDLPSGYLPQSGSARELTNDLLVQLATDKEVAAKNIKEWQRVSGWEVRFNNTNNPTKLLPQGVYVEVVVFQTANGARNSVKQELEPDQYIVSAQRLGDESEAHGSSYQSNGSVFAYYQVTFHIRNVLGVVRTYGPVGTEDLGPALDIAAKLAKRIDAAEWVDAATLSAVPSRTSIPLAITSPTTTVTPFSPATVTPRATSVPPTASPTVAAILPQAQPASIYPDGNYLIGIDLPPGTYRTVGPGDSCYWARKDRNQKTINNSIGSAGGLLTLISSDFELRVDDCGGFVPLSQVPRLSQNDQFASHRDGKYLPGYDIAPGIWRSDGSAGGDSCYWARRDINQKTLDNYIGNPKAVVTIRSTDAEIDFDDCGLWTRISD